MRKRLIYSILCCIAAATMVVACTHEGNEGAATTITPDKTTISFTYEGTSEPVVITTSAAWTIANATDWLTIEPTSGIGITTIFVTAANNETITARNTSLTISAENAPSATISVTQSGMATTLPAEAGVITGLGTNNCPHTVSVDLTAEPITDAVSYVWYHNGTIIYNITGLTYTATETGAYTYAGVNNLGVGAPSGEKRVVIEVCQVPDAPVITGGDENTCPVKTVVLTIAADPNATSRQWYKDGNAIAGATELTYTVTESGTYTATGINSLGEGAMSAGHEVTIEICPFTVDELVGVWDKTEFLIQSSTAYNNDGTVTIEKIDETTVRILEFDMDIPTIIATVNTTDVTLNIAYQEIIPTWNSSYRTFLAPVIESTFCNNVGLDFPAQEVVKEGDYYTITFACGLSGTIDGAPYNVTWVAIATNASLVCQGNFGYAMGTKWVKQTPNPMPAPASISKIDLPKRTGKMELDTNLHIDLVK